MVVNPTSSEPKREAYRLPTPLTAQVGSEIRRDYKAGGDRVIDALDFIRSERKLAAKMSLEQARNHFSHLLTVIEQLITTLP